MSPGPLFLHAGKDVAHLMLDFIDWLTNQDFGRRCILSVRDVLSWVHFMNRVCGQEGADECQAALDAPTAFVHAACLVYIDGIGSGESVDADGKAASFSAESLPCRLGSGGPGSPLLVYTALTWFQLNIKVLHAESGCPGLPKLLLVCMVEESEHVYSMYSARKSWDTHSIL